MSKPNLLRHYANLNAAYLHANGEQGTEYLLQQLPVQGAERVVELGFGTGATLVKLKARFPGITLHGLEASRNMLATAGARLRFCRLQDQVKLLHLDERDQIPAGSIDLVYAESVLAILDDKSLSDTLRYCFNILKPTGLLALNESIWLESVSLPEIRAINAHCREAFGIIQCSEAMAGMEAAIRLIETNGFVALAAARIPPKRRYGTQQKNYREFLSRLFTLFGKSRLLFQARLRNRHAQFSADMGAGFVPGREYLSGTVFLFKKAWEG